MAMAKLMGFSSMSSFSCSYWKLSLLVHPDKCSHPDAAKAFQVLNSALKALNDPEKVRIVRGMGRGTWHGHGQGHGHRH